MGAGSWLLSSHNLYEQEGKKTFISLAFSAKLVSARETLQRYSQTASGGNRRGTNGFESEWHFQAVLTKACQGGWKVFIQLFSAFGIARSSSLAVWLTAREGNVNSEGPLSEYYNPVALNEGEGKRGAERGTKRLKMWLNWDYYRHPWKLIYSINFICFRSDETKPDIT